MKRLSTAVITLLLITGADQSVYAEKGFSIRGGLLHDSPSTDVFREMESGIGYIGSFGFDFIDRAGLELGVLHSTHDYIFDIVAGAVREREADKTTFFIKARAIPYRIGQAEFVLGIGPAFFDITGSKLRTIESGTFELEEGFSGWGLVTSVDLRYFVSDGLALTFYISGNFAKYRNFSISSADADYPGDFPRGDSVSWGLTVFHRIGMPKL